MRRKKNRRMCLMGDEGGSAGCSDWTGDSGGSPG